MGVVGEEPAFASDLYQGAAEPYDRYRLGYPGQ